MLAVEKFREERARYIKSLRLVSAYSLAANMSMLAMPIFMFNTYRNVLPSQNMATLFGLFIFVLVLLIAMGVFDAARQILLARAAARFEAELAGFVIAGELNRQHDAKAQTIGQLAQLKALMSSSAMTSLFDLPMFPIFTLIIFIIHPYLGMVLLVSVVVMILLAIRADRAVAPYMEAQQTRSSAVQRALGQHFSMQEYVRAQGLFRESLNDWGQQQNKLLKDNLGMANSTAVNGGLSKAVRQLIQIMLIAVGAILVLAGEGDIIMIIAASIIGGKALQPIDMLIGSWKQLRQGYTNYKAIRQRLTELHVPDKTTPLPPPKGAMEVSRMTYVPAPGAPPILKGIQFALKPGESMGIIGPSGAGKSTLAKVLVGLYEPPVGSVTLDGQNLKVWDPIARGHHIGYIPQNVEFFDGTIQENIASLRREDPKEWAVAAAQRAGVHELILTMPQGYDTVIRKGGFTPSGGQAQLIALARAFYGDPRVLILDEPNSALDQQGEQILHAALVRAKKENITTILVTQRPVSLRFMDKVLILQNGQVQDFGPRDEVMKNQKVRAVSSSQQQPSAQQQAQNQESPNQQPGGDQKGAAS